MADMLSKEQIEWRLIPPHAPYFGGLWESGVKSAKYHLKRVIGPQALTFEELYTVTTQIEACLNSRPLCLMSSDPSALTPLTPGHFLIGVALMALPEHDLTDTKQNRLTRCQLTQQLFQHFWKRWQKEYLHQLQQRTKWHSSPANRLTPSTMVLIKEDHLPPLSWSLGRII
ncbi:uncharacterized protein LOC143342785 [Colletes latitarsis]|uniref:uncharacterized protein LOC143342785 n=1 Tax=Colletes latitarsis TaxID=2605962 RepID=UPI004035B014